MKLNTIKLSRFSDIHPSKKVTQQKSSFLAISNTLGFVEEIILPRNQSIGPFWFITQGQTFSQTCCQTCCFHKIIVQRIYIKNHFQRNLVTKPSKKLQTFTGPLFKQCRYYLLSTHLFYGKLPKKIAFRYHHYECFCSQIDLTKLTVVDGGLGNSLNKKCVYFSDGASLKNQQKC